MGIVDIKKVEVEQKGRVVKVELCELNLAFKGTLIDVFETDLKLDLLKERK